MAVTINQAMVWLGELTQPSSIVSISVQSDNNPRIGCEIASRLAEHQIPVAFARVRPCGKKYEAIYGFSLQEDADRAVELISQLRKARNFWLELVGTGGGIKTKKNNPPRKMRKSA